jgi:ubiquinone/menaquinone biosynthesis C-methylase UbiE
MLASVGVDDVRPLSIRTDAVDVIVFGTTLVFISEVDYVLKEAIRVLRPSGTAGALILNIRSGYAPLNRQREDPISNE